MKPPENSGNKRLDEITFEEFMSLDQEERDRLWDAIRPEYEAAAAAHFRKHPEDGWVAFVETPSNVCAHGPMSDYPKSKQIEEWARARNKTVFTLSRVILSEEIGAGCAY